ncbi:MAG TPA: shikimate kinase [Candidatus Baltobacteraceae bacterium]|nr:shikimate kinase [Candidatus Baltobacteraceae bacterium]
MKRHVALTGFMAAGKSTIGKKLARKLATNFYDVDDLIVKDHGPVADIFYAQGETAFREYEFQAISDIVDSQEPGIISLGGGAVTYDKSLALLKKRAYRVFIKVTPEQILGRLRRSKRVRPLVGPSPSLSKIKDLYAQRMPRYAHADLVVEADALTTAQIVDRIVAWMHHKNIQL